MKNIALFPARSRFPVKLTYCIAYNSSFMTLQSFISTFKRKCPVFSVLSFFLSKDKPKIPFTPWKLGLIKASQYWFSLSIFTFNWYLFLLVALLKPDFNCCNNFALLLMLQAVDNVLHLLLQISFCHLQQKQNNVQSKLEWDQFRSNYWHCKSSQKIT